MTPAAHKLLAGKPRNRPEYKLHVATADLFRAILPPQVLWLHIPNGGGRDVVTAMHLQRMGLRPGVPDFLIAWRYWDENVGNVQETLWLELKSKSGRTSKEQEAFEGIVTRIGHGYAVAKSTDDVEAVLSAYSVPRRGRIAA